MNYGGLVLILIGAVMIFIGWNGTQNSVWTAIAGKPREAPSA